MALAGLEHGARHLHMPQLLSLSILVPRIGRRPTRPELALRSPHASDTTQSATAAPRRWVWGLVGTLLVLEALTLVMVCLWQIHLGEVRQQEQRLRAARYVQCLEQTPEASIARCRRRAASAP